MHKYEQKDLKKWAKVFALRFTTKRYNTPMTKDKYTIRPVTSIEKVTVLDVIKEGIFWKTKKIVLWYTVQNELDEIFHIDRHYLYMRRQFAMKALYREVKSLLGKNLQDFITKHS